jgi:sugar phosphate isomerase/epimerase
MITRRRLIASLAAGGRLWCQERASGAAGRRSAPSLCLYSRILAKVDYNDLPMVLRGLGFDGCDLSVERGGHVDPAGAGNTLMPALEAITGAGLEAAAITTAFTSAADPGAAAVFGLASVIGVPVFRTGALNFTGPPGAAESRVQGLAAYARASRMVLAIPNTAVAGSTLSELDAALRRFDPRLAGFDFDASALPVQDAGGLDAAFRLAAPRLVMVTARDRRADGSACPLGQGIVNWPRLFGLLAGARFTGPVSLRIAYRPEDELGAIRRDLGFLRNQVASAYAKG